VTALVCNFPKPGSDGSPPLLEHNEVVTFFHEFGHALHSVLSRTEYQHFSGTRTNVDFVELPSHLFEYFAWDERVLGKFARHHATGAPLPPTQRPIAAGSA
jgi:intermediate peptidase